jgi:hypothetical protein
MGEEPTNGSFAKIHADFQKLGAISTPTPTLVLRQDTHTMFGAKNVNMGSA